MSIGLLTGGVVSDSETVIRVDNIQVSVEIEDLEVEVVLEVGNDGSNN